MDMNRQERRRIQREEEMKKRLKSARTKEQQIDGQICMFAM
jgi:hypothetical protein